MEEKKREEQIRKSVKDSHLSDTVSDYLPDLIVDCSKHGQVFIEEGVAVDVSIFKYSDGEYNATLLKNIAEGLSINLKMRSYGDYDEPDYFIFELRQIDKERPTNNLYKVAELIFAVLDCCDESATIEAWDMEERYVRIKVDGHYHS